MTKEELVALVTRIMNPSEFSSEKELDKLLEELQQNVTDPNISDYIYFEDNTPVQVVEKALNYKVVELPPQYLKSK